MEKKILIAVDDSIHSNQSMQYAAKLLSDSKEVTFTLFHRQPMISQYLLEEAKTHSKANETLKEFIQKNTVKAQILLEKQKEGMIAMGVPDHCIEMVSQPMMVGLAKDILEYGRKGIYDAIVVGRRGLSRIQKTFMGSTSAKLLEHSHVIPVWMVDGNVRSQKILVAVDGSESSYRAIDHIGFMLSENPEIHYGLFHVYEDATDIDASSLGIDDFDINELMTHGSKRRMETFFADAKQKLAQAGIAADRIEIITTRRKANVGKMIIKEAKKGNYGTVVVGRRGINRAHYFGSVSRYVTERITDRALWLVS